jgi:arginine/lysine/ornithine decarboxylase
MTSLHSTHLPLFACLHQLAQQDAAVFHTPGHKKGRAIPPSLRQAWGPEIFAADLPELPELGNLFTALDPPLTSGPTPDPELESATDALPNALHQAQTLAAQAFGADRTWFLVNGSTAGILGAILATCGPGDKIILPRTIHQSAISGLILSGAIPIFVAPAYDPHWGLTGNVTPQAIDQALNQNPDAKAVLVVSPTYQGISADLATIAHLTHHHQIPLLVDEAHGPHFGFHPHLPLRALDQGADLAIQSTHKVLSALTQGAMVHLKGSRIDAQRLHQSLQLIQSTSPSYLLLASLDGARQQMVSLGPSLLSQTLDLAHQAQTRLGTIPALRVFQLPKTQAGFFSLDPTRLTLEVSGLGLTGFELDQQLHRQFQVTAELPSLHHLTFIISMGNNQRDVDRLVNALATIAQNTLTEKTLVQNNLIQNNLTQNTMTLEQSTNPAPSQFSRPFSRPFSSPDLPPSNLALSPREAFFAPKITLTGAAAIGHISAETISAYPPGIPILLPGEVISAEALAFLQQVQREGGMISGCHDASLATFQVC